MKPAHTVSKAISKILRAELVVVDDIGLLPVAADAAEGLYRLVDAAYEKRSVAISSNLHPAGFDELMPKTLATATVDRLLHHAHVCQTTGESVRLSQAEIVISKHDSSGSGRNPVRPRSAPAGYAAARPPPGSRPGCWHSAPEELTPNNTFGLLRVSCASAPVEHHRGCL